MNRLMAIFPVLLCAGGTLGDELAFDPTLTPGEKARSIAVEAESRDAGFADTVTELVMTLRNEEGRERRRRLTWQTLEVSERNEGDKSLTIFHEPRDIAGTAFLSHTHIGREDDQWIFLPALKRVKRIAASNMSSAFVGSEFAYEDLLSDEPEKFDFRWLRDEACGEWQCHVVERRPVYEGSGYSRQVVWYDMEELRQIKIDYYDRRNRHEKTLELMEYRIYLDRHWRPHLMQMEDHLTEKLTLLEFGDFQFQTGLTEQDFDPSALRRLR